MKIKVRLTPTWWVKQKAWAEIGQAVDIAQEEFAMCAPEVRVTASTLHIVAELSDDMSVRAVIKGRDAARQRIEAVCARAGS